MLLIVFCFLAVCCDGKQSKQVFAQNSGKLFSENLININQATKEQLATLPNIGKKTVENIIEHREKYGRFRKSEHLLLVPGISEKKFREIKNLIRTE
ncbi:MAG: ComEA family DNA-binding protein [Pyrinomonadaceae bacterium]|nr:ComEA family DNA-binding protein [Pyrinomonadaceae bacterium]